MAHDPETLVRQFGEYPHEFVWILRVNTENKHLNLDEQSRLWKDTLGKYPINGFDHRAWTLWAISDNGDLLFHDHSKRVAIVDPRVNDFAIHPITPQQCLETLPELLPDVFK